MTTRFALQKKNEKEIIEIMLKDKAVMDGKKTLPELSKIITRL